MRRLLRPLRRTGLGNALAQSRLRAQYWKDSWNAARTLWFAYGHLRTVQTKAAVDRNGQPVPWYTYPAIEYLQQFDFSESSVFEYGSGNSTLFWAQRAARVVSVEDDEQWYAKLRPHLGANCTLVLEPDLDRFVDVITRFPERFDIIVVDGPARGQTRLKCATRALDSLRPGGLIILDNSDWLPRSARLLRGTGLLQVDMSGFIPLGGHTQTTSLFFDRTCELRPRDGRQPHPSAGACLKNWEPEPSAGPGNELTWGGTPIKDVVETMQLTKATVEGPRVFDVAFQETAPSLELFIYIYDRSAGRLLLSHHGLRLGTTVAEERRRLEAMTWDEFCEFIRSSPMRRYLLKELPKTFTPDAMV